jgi:predicted metalloendopeptidase
MYPLATILYNSYLDESYINEYCMDELRQLMEIVDLIKTPEDLIIMSTRLLFINVNTLFSLSVDASVNSSCKMIAYFGQPNLGLPDRAYYNDIKFKIIKQKYYETICKLHKLLYPNLSDNEINLIASIIIKIEKALSIIFMSNADRRNTDLIFHELSLLDANIKYPKLQMNNIIKMICICVNSIKNEEELIEENFTKIIMEHSINEETNYFKQLEILIDNFELYEWKIYFKHKIMLTYGNLSIQAIKNIFFDMFKKTLNGQLIPKPPQKAALNLTTSLLLDPISRIYTYNSHNRDVIRYMKRMVLNIKKATRRQIINLKWMTKETKKKALLKLHKMKLKLEYSKSEPKNYEHMKLGSSIIKNTMMLNKENFIINLKRINTFDPDEWDMPSFNVNAYFNPTRNEIVFPSAILQPPFIDLTKSDIYNYANIGSIIGHEIIHGFDDQGSKFDENGSLNDWWKSEDKIAYETKVNQIINIYEAEGINGKLTAGENIADFGAVKMPLIGLKYHFERELTNDEIRDFYKFYASHWQYLLRKEAVDDRLLTDPHAFADLRVNIPLKHQELFQKVYKTSETDKMHVDVNDILDIW